MELDYYFFLERKRSKLTQKKFADKIGISNHALSSYVNKKRTPELLTALKIYFETKKEVKLYDLLSKEDFEDLNNLYGVIKEVEI